MDQHQPGTGSPLPRRLLRVLVLAGAAAVWWLLLSGGPAQADDSAVAHDAAAPVAAPGAAQRAVSVVTGPVREVPARAAQVGHRVATQAPGSVGEVVPGLVAAVEPAVTSATADIADLLDRTALRVDAAVAPVLHATHLSGSAPEAAADSADPAPVPATSPGHHRARPVHRPDALVPAVQPAPQPVAVPGSAPFGPLVAGVDSPLLPASPDSPGAPAGGPVSGAGAAVLAGFLLLVPTTARRRRPRDGGAVPAGPGHLPGCSPD
jgi:hypothetical protein